jgi:hypothetical protein
MPNPSNNDEFDTDWLAPGNLEKAEKRPKKVGPRQPKRRKSQVENVDP